MSDQRPGRLRGSDRQAPHLVGSSELMTLLETDFEESGPTRVSGSFAADERHHQPWGLVHGGLGQVRLQNIDG